MRVGGHCRCVCEVLYRVLSPWWSSPSPHFPSFFMLSFPTTHDVFLKRKEAIFDLKRPLQYSTDSFHRFFFWSNQPYVSHFNVLVVAVFPSRAVVLRISDHSACTLFLTTGLMSPWTFYPCSCQCSWWKNSNHQNIETVDIRLKILHTGYRAKVACLNVKHPDIFVQVPVHSSKCNAFRGIKGNWGPFPAFIPCDPDTYKGVISIRTHSVMQEHSEGQAEQILQNLWESISSRVSKWNCQSILAVKPHVSLGTHLCLPLPGLFFLK